MKEILSQKAERMMKMASDAGKIAITTHIKPDGDAIGSTTGLYHFLKAYGCRSLKIVLPSMYPDNLAFISAGTPSEDVIVYENTPDKAIDTIRNCDLVFCLDFNAFNRTEYLETALEQSPAAKILIDHHLHPDRSKFDEVFSEIEISSASEVLFHILMNCPGINDDAALLPRECANALYSGMTTDTNNFRNSTYPSTLVMASKLIAAGVDRDAIVEKVMHSYRENRLKLLGLLLKDRMTITGNGGACMVLDKETMLKYDVKEGDTEGFVNIPLDVSDICLSVFIKEDQGKARVSVRSKKGTSANKCATRYFHGGGHENASGGKILFPDDIPGMDQAMGYGVKCIEEFLSEQ